MDIIEMCLNESQLKRLGMKEEGTYRTSLEVMTGIQPRRTVLYTNPVVRKNFPITMEKVKVMQLMV